MTPRLTLNLQAEAADLALDVPGFSRVWPLTRDRAVGLAYAFSSDLILKLEAHDNEGYLVDDTPPSGFLGPPMDTHYGIVSLSVSF